MKSVLASVLLISILGSAANARTRTLGNNETLACSGGFNFSITPESSSEREIFRVIMKDYFATFTTRVRYDLDKTPITVVLEGYSLRTGDDVSRTKTFKLYNGSCGIMSLSEE